MSINKENTAQLPSQSNVNFKDLYNRKNTRTPTSTTVSTVIKTKPSGKISKTSQKFISEIDYFFLVREKFKQRIENSDQEATVHMKEQDCEQKRTNNAEVLLDFNKNLLEKLQSQRNHTDTVMQQALNRCQSLWQQLEQPDNHVEELNLLEQSMVKRLEDLQN